MQEEATTKVDYTADKVAVVRINGFLNVHSRPEVEQCFKGILAEKKYNILISLKDLDFISSAGVALFIPVAKKVREAGGDLRFSCIPVKVWKIFEMLGFTKIFKTFDSDEEGIKSFS